MAFEIGYTEDHGILVAQRAKALIGDWVLKMTRLDP